VGAPYAYLQMENWRAVALFAVSIGLVAWKPYVASIPADVPQPVVQPAQTFVTKQAPQVYAVPMPAAPAAEARATTTFTDMVRPAKSLEGKRLALFPTMEDGPEAIVPRKTRVAFAMNTPAEPPVTRGTGYSIVTASTTMD